MMTDSAIWARDGNVKKMTDRAEIERLLNMTGRTLEGLPEHYEPEEALKASKRGKERGWTQGEVILHQSDVIELLVVALRDSEPKREYGNCHHCKNGTYSCPITQMSGTLIRYANFCDECGRDLRAVVAEYWRKKDE